MKNIHYILTISILFFSSNLSAQKLSEPQTRATFKFVFGYDDIDKVTEEDKRKAILFTKELIQKSCAMSVIEGLVRGSVSPSSSLKSIIIKLAKTADCGHDDIENGKIYKVVRDELKRKWKSAYAIRSQTGQW